MPPKVIAAVTTTKVNLRSIPSKQGEVLRAISAGTRVLLSKRDTEWVFGRVGQQSGWLHAQFIDQFELASAKVSTVVVASEPKDPLLQLLKEKQSLEIELSDSRTQVISFENELALVQTKYRKSEDEFISLSEASEGKSRQMIKLKQKLGIAENRQLRVEEAFAGFNAKIVGLNQALTELESVKRKKILKLEAKDQQFEQLKTQYVEKQTELEKLRLENGSRGQLISDYETEKTEVAARYGDLVATAETSKQDVTRLKAELLQVESDRQLTQNELAESQKQAGNFEKAVAAVQQSKKLISAELSLSGEQLNISNASLAELRSAEQLIQKKYRKSKDKFISLSEASEGKSRQIVKLKQTLGIAENRQLRVEEAFVGFNAKIEGLNQALTELESVKKEKILKFEAKDQQFEQLKTQYVEKQTELEKLRLQHGSRGLLISDYETEKAEVTARYIELVATAELNLQDVTRLKAELLQVESDRQLTQNELAESQKQAGNFEKAVAAAQQSKKLISAELALSDEQLNISSASLAELRSAEQLVVTRYNKINVELDDVKQSFFALQTDKQQLADKLIENKAHIVNLNQTLDDELVTKQLIADELTVATTQTTYLENILNENQVNLQSLITERDIRWAKIVTLEKIRADEQAENQLISNKMQVDSKHIASLEESLDQTHGDLQIVVSKLENSQTQVGILEQSFEKLRASNQLTAIEKLSNQKQMDSLKNELSQVKLENQFVSSTLEASNRMNVILEEMLVKLKLDVKFRASELAASRTWSEKIQKSLTAVWDQQQFDTAALNDGEKKIQNLKKDLAQTRVEKNQVSTRLATNEASISHFEASLASAELEKNNLSEKLEASKTRADKLEKSLTQLQNAHKLDADILIGLRGNQQNQSVQIETLNADLVRKQTENNSLLIEYSEWQGELANFKDKLALLQSDNQASESMLVASYDEISALEKLLGNYKGGVAELINLLGQYAANVSDATIQRVLNDSGFALQIDQLMPIQLLGEAPTLASSVLNGESAGDLHLAEIERFVRDWAQSWSQKNVSNYFAFYGSDFFPGDGLNYEQWKQLRRKRLSQPRFIEVSISDLKVTKLVSGNLKVTFGQVYRTESYRDQIVKKLEMVKNNSGWKIIREESL
jgi:chromosome segregation ATPase